MKREILCELCVKKVKRLVLPSEPGEYVKFMSGTLRSSCVCDNCNVGLNVGEPVSAMSMWTDRIPYEEWEHKFVEAQ